MYGAWCVLRAACSFLYSSSSCMKTLQHQSIVSLFGYQMIVFIPFRHFIAENFVFFSSRIFFVIPIFFPGRLYNWAHVFAITLLWTSFGISINDSARLCDFPIYTYNQDFQSITCTLSHFWAIFRYCVFVFQSCLIEHIWIVSMLRNIMLLFYMYGRRSACYLRHYLRTNNYIKWNGIMEYQEWIRNPIASATYMHIIWWHSLWMICIGRQTGTAIYTGTGM